MGNWKLYGWIAALVLLGACARHGALPPPADLSQPSPIPAPAAPIPPSPPPANIELQRPAPLGAGDLARIASLIPADLRRLLSEPAADGLARLVERTLETGPSGRAVPWALDQASGTITPKPLRRTQQSAQCRDIAYGIGSQTLNLTACKGADGRWALKP